MTSVKNVFFASVLFLFIPVVLSALPGDPDPTFNSTGNLVTSLSKDSDMIQAIALQSDGKVVSAGRSWNTDGTQSFVLARFNSNGTIDTSFGSGGKVFTSFGTQYSWANDVAVQTDGKILAGGFSTDQPGPGSFAFARYLPDGSLDPAFSGDGKITTSFGSNDAEAHSLALRPDGRIVAAGIAGGNFALAGYNTDGTPDDTFGVGGKLTTPFTRVTGATAFSIKIQPNNGKLIVAGEGTIGNRRSFLIARYRSNGLLDRTFAGGWIAKTFGFGPAIGFDVEIDTVGRYVVAGTTYTPDSSHSVCALVRYNPKGSLDPTFDDDGVLITQTGTRYGTIFSLVVQPDGKILAGGEGRDEDQSNNSNSFLLRYNTDGTLDNSFGIGGKVQTAMTNSNDLILSIALQPDGRIVTGGAAVDSSHIITDSVVARFLNDGTVKSPAKEKNVPAFPLTIYDKPSH